VNVEELNENPAQTLLPLSRHHLRIAAYSNRPGATANGGMVGAFAVLWIMGSPFGFMAFLGVASLVGVIVSHVIVLFDFIEEEHEKARR
jgi:hypothetical protein